MKDKEGEREEGGGRREEGRESAWAGESGGRKFKIKEGDEGKREAGETGETGEAHTYAGESAITVV
ncbi:hypothetical protein N7456_004456 [Penicillium angulare]|uniref:Uncharacterized protein n=1 Tax=Penicillium angulare TaxID=116970 RepID=A0A9W9FWL9_9EURO|nr:hypothetical protein N7456_004456 [Penicillium angulare]